MPTNLDYTSRARKIAYRFPKFSFIAIQVNFWILAILLYSAITYLNTEYLGQFQPLVFTLSPYIVLISSISIGLLLGIILGFIDLALIRMGFQKLSFGLVILLRIIIYPLVLLVIVGFARFFMAGWIDSHFPTDYSALIDNQITWRFFYWSLLLYIAFMAAVISFINQMNSKFGPGVLIPLLLGNYRKPREQERFFMFLDLKSSATHAEKLGHLEYSSMIRDSFLDLNHVLTRNNAEIYQYVGDEAVITWPAEEGIRKMVCLALFFDFQDELSRRRDYYLKRYGFVPEFKAGLHVGTITAVEVGDVKREIAYHGDTINTAARIQGMCNTLDGSFLVSGSVRSLVPKHDDRYRFVSLGSISLKGKDKPVELFNVTRSS